MRLFYLPLVYVCLGAMRNKLTLTRLFDAGAGIFGAAPSAASSGGFGRSFAQLDVCSRSFRIMQP